MKNKIYAALAALLIVISVSGCSGGDSSETQSNTADTMTAPQSVNESETAAESVAETSTESVSEADADEPQQSEKTDVTTSQVDGSVIVASLENPESVDKPELFEVNMAEFNKLYKLHLKNEDIDETDPDNAEQCAELRKMAINTLFMENVVLYEAARAGLGIDSLTEEEIKTVNDSFNETLSELYDAYETEAVNLLKEEKGIAEDSDETDFYTEEELNEKEKELVQEYLDECGISFDDLKLWEKNEFVQNKYIDHLLEGITVSDEEAQAMVDERIKEAKEAYESDPASFEVNGTYLYFYIPEGSRSVEHILFKFDDETVSEIMSLRQSGDDEAADKLREEKLAELSETAESVLKQLNGGADFDELQEEYNEDTGGNSAAYTVIPDSTMWIAGFADAAFAIEEKGGISPLVPTDYGYHIIKYVEDAEITDDELDSLREQAKSYELYMKQSEKISEQQQKLEENYPALINYEALNISEDDAAEEEQTVTDKTETAETDETGTGETDAGADDS